MNLGQISFDIGDKHFQGKKAASMLLLASLTLIFGLRRYFAGGRCRLRKDLSGQIALITGGNSGIGKQTAKRLLELGCIVIIGARDQEKCKRTVEELSKVGKGKIVAHRLDLSDKQKVQQFAIKVKRELLGFPLNYLINNAGVMAVSDLKITKQNLEYQIAVNHFGHFYLTYLLWAELKKSGNPRIINISSNAHRYFRCQLNLNDLNYQKTAYDPWYAYANSKKANIMFTKQLQERMEAAGMNDAVSVSVHPGAVRTELNRYFVRNIFARLLFIICYPIILLTFKTAREGSQTTIYAILQDPNKLKKGEYYADCKPAKIGEECLNTQKIKLLWAKSEQAFGIQFSV